MRIYVVMNQSWRHLDKLLFSLIQIIQMVMHRNIYKFVYMHGLLYTHIFPCLASWEGLETMTPQQQQAHLLLTSQFIMSFSNKGKQGSLEKFLRLRPDIYKMSLKRFKVSESKEVLKHTHTFTHAHTLMGICQKDSGDN